MISRKVSCDFHTNHEKSQIDALTSVFNPMITSWICFGVSLVDWINYFMLCLKGLVVKQTVRSRSVWESNRKKYWVLSTTISFVNVDKVTFIIITFGVPSDWGWNENNSFINRVYKITFYHLKSALIKPNLSNFNGLINTWFLKSSCNLPGFYRRLVDRSDCYGMFWVRANNTSFALTNVGFCTLRF